MNDSMKPNSCKLHAIQKSRGNLYLIRWHVTKKISSYILQRSSCKAFQNSLQKMIFSLYFLVENAFFDSAIFVGAKFGKIW